MNNKDITGLNNLDVNGQIDVKGNKITGVAEGTNPNDEVNKHNGMLIIVIIIIQMIWNIITKKMSTFQILTNTHLCQTQQK